METIKGVILKTFKDIKKFEKINLSHFRESTVGINGFLN